MNKPGEGPSNAWARLNSLASRTDDSMRQEYPRQQFENLAQRFSIGMIVLFGSIANDRAGSESDIDIGILLNGSISDDSLQIESSISRELWKMLHPRREIDLVILNSASSLMKCNVAKSGIPLYLSSPELWRSFRLRAFREFEDDMRFRNRRWEQVKRSIRDGTGA